MSNQGKGKEEQKKFYDLKQAIPKLKPISYELNSNKENKEIFDKQDWLLLKLIIEINEVYFRE